MFYLLCAKTFKVSKIKTDSFRKKIIKTSFQNRLLLQRELFIAYPKMASIS